MSAHVSLGCDRQIPHGTCPERVYVFGVDTLDEARALAAEHGWHRSDGKDRCPSCAGSPRRCPPILRPAR